MMNVSTRTLALMTVTWCSNSLNPEVQKRDGLGYVLSTRERVTLPCLLQCKYKTRKTTEYSKIKS